ncbi:flagellar hook capping FlgD N-terminal domain-containing protein [Granulicella sibirica]|uniref:Basal-body rod modification protein FlgD n=1 Tax=Granulicella sibirica TaxID=2479048 RepID=A0A4Q0T1F4_9BACT|nr:flagellar hook capping FlgD N-terminal domain-containing protein [Granulicella sibirica]RXH56612.1 Flagellar basal-body rod modification protein FlgD [Granulicella sibirica]
MSVFDIGNAQSTAFQDSASVVATALAPKRHATAAQTIMAEGSNSVKAHSATSSSTSTATTGDATITANDFLTLLVTELQNQDPTQPTDPNAYIEQLVGVNSLQQLISINQGITSITSGTTTTTGSVQAAPVSQIQNTQPPETM